MNTNEIKTNEAAKNEVAQKNYYENYVHPFWSLFNDVFSNDTETDVMRTDIYDEGKDYKLEVEVPGVDKKDIRLSLDKGYLSISAKVHKENNSGKYLHAERSTGSFSRSFYVGNHVAKSDIDASCNNGILTVVINKPQEPKQEEKFIDIR